MSNNLKLEPSVNELICLTPDEKWLKLWNIKCSRKNKVVDWSFVSRKERPEIHAEGQTYSDAVIICAVVPVSCSNDEDRIVLTREFRYPIGDYELGLPAGLTDSGETPLETATKKKPD